MHPFLVVAAAHFLALLSPGPDFFLIARGALAGGWRLASGACLGIALANGLFILLAFSGVAAMQQDQLLFLALQAAGAAYLIYLAYLFLRHAGSSSLQAQDGEQASSWWCSFKAGLLSGLLNPKNALFYASLATLLGPDLPRLQQWAYGVWMFSVVLLWDLLVAVLIGHPRILHRFGAALPWLERCCGVILGLMGLALLLRLALAV